MSEEVNRDRDIMNVTGQEIERDFPVENQPVKAPSRPITPDQHFLNKFLEDKEEEKAEAAAPSEPKPDVAAPDNKEDLNIMIIEAIREIYDPEIPVNIYEMGLIYTIDIADDFTVKLGMTLTTPHCPVAESMPGEVEVKVKSVPGVVDCEVSLVWEPAWDMSYMSDEARLELGLL